MTQVNPWIGINGSPNGWYNVDGTPYIHFSGHWWGPYYVAEIEFQNILNADFSFLNGKHGIFIRAVPGKPRWQVKFKDAIGNSSRIASFSEKSLVFVKDAIVRLI